MFPDLPLESGESGLEKVPSPTAPPPPCHPLPQNLVSSTPALPSRASHVDRVVSELPGRHAPGNPLSSSDLKDGIAGRAPDHRGSGLHPGFLPLLSEGSRSHLAPFPLSHSPISSVSQILSRITQNRCLQKRIWHLTCFALRALLCLHASFFSLSF